jgi:hypothetical protein
VTCLLHLERIQQLRVIGVGYISWLVHLSPLTLFFDAHLMFLFLDTQMNT